MKGRRCDFEGEPDKGHDDAGEQKRRERLRSKTFCDGCKTGGARHAINQAQPEEMKSELSGEITSMPWNKFACDGKLSTAPMATMSPNAATNEQTTVEAVVSIARLCGIAGDTPATTVPRLVVRPITRTMSAVNVTI